MAFLDDLDMVRRRLGRTIVLPTPPAALALMEHARAAGIAVGNLSVLSRPLSAGIAGSYDRATGDLWCQYDARDEQGGRDLLGCLLTLMAYIHLHAPPPTTIEEDWQQARAAHREAFALANAWGHAALFTEEDLTERLAHDHQLFLAHTAAGEVAGTLAPSLARQAYLALLPLQERFQWSEATFLAALHGVSDDEQSNAAVLDMDRCALRRCWSLDSTHVGSAEPDPFGTYTLAHTPATARVLRQTLGQVASHRVQRGSLRLSPPPGDRMQRVCVSLETAQDLAYVLAWANAWLVEDFPRCCVRVRWSLYADQRSREDAVPCVHLYQLSIAYHADPGEEQTVATDPRERELWVFVPARPRTQTVEAAWQRYLRAWLACSTLQVHPLADGLRSLWSWLEP